MPGSVAEGRVPVTVVAGDRRVDVSLPASVPTVEVLPDVARALGIDDVPATVLSRPDGTGLDPDAGAGANGVRPGEVLVLGPAPPPPRRYDDAAELAADLLDEETSGPEVHGLLPALALWGFAAVAVLAGWVAAAGQETGIRLVVAGGVLAVLAVGSAVHPGPLRWVALPLAPVGVGAVAVGLATHALPVPVSALVAVLVVLVVVSTRAFPAAALAGPAGRHAAGAVDRERLAEDLRFAGAALLAASVAASVMVVLAVPLLVVAGPGGAVLALACCVVLLLRDRAVRRDPLRLSSQLPGVVGLVAVVATWLVLHPAAALPVLGGLAAAVGLVAARPWSPGSAYAARAADVLEALGLLALAPLLVVTTGVLEVVGW